LGISKSEEYELGEEDDEGAGFDEEGSVGGDLLTPKLNMPQKRNKGGVSVW